jgi:beta-galactosidase
MVRLINAYNQQFKASYIPSLEGQEIAAQKQSSKGWVRKIVYLFTILFVTLFANAQPRQIIDFNKGWKFYLGNDTAARLPEYNDSKWRSLSVPHDWSIESDFIKDAPATPEGGSLPGGIGWYRKTFVLPASAKDKIVTIEFDGVYQNSEVWINGHYLGKRPNGYVNFSYELTKHLKPAPQKNSIAVKVDNSQQPNSRWYSGSGIYRNVNLVIKNKTSINKEQLQVFAEAISLSSCQLLIKGPFHSNPLNFPIKVRIFNSDNKLVSEIVSVGKVGEINTKVILYAPQLWSVDNPKLYKINLQLKSLNEIVDEITIPFGIRSFHFDKDKGFFLNNQPLKLQGVCMHHDLGALGAAFNKEAARRQLKILKEMGTNAIRFSHNPPATEMLDLCDEMGFLVIDEAFDMWKKKKNKYDYHKDFVEWHKKDLEAMVYRDRNHPSVILWSIGNEIREQFDSTGITITKELVGIVKAIDPTRPVISAMTETKPQYNFIAKSNALDVFGFNYREYDYDSLPVRFPNQKFIGTEIASSIATRGVYYRPSDSIRTWPPDYKHQPDFDGGNPDFTGPAYDNTKAYWGNTHEKAWLAVKKSPHVAGGFIWSGFDYIGEPLPYPKFPARSSYFGVIDLAGFPKDAFYMYQSEWSKKNVLHIFPHWTWNKGDSVDVWAYYNNADEVELFINGKSAGKRSKTDSALHVLWKVAFEPGTLKAVSRKSGKQIAIKEMSTAGKPARIELVPDKKILQADGKDMCFITARVVDAEGRLVPDANHLLRFSINGNAIIVGTDNGYQADISSLKSTNRRAWKGMALAMVQAGEKKGNSTLTVVAEGLPATKITLLIGGK